MSRLSIVTVPNPSLREVAVPITEFEPELGDMAEQMFTLIDKIGIGLAANQVGIPIRLIVVAVPGYEKVAMCNPVIERKKGLKVEPEGCLSEPGLKVHVARATKIRVNYQTLSGESKSMSAVDLFARCIQHEVEHLDGILISDHIQEAA